MKRCTTCGFEDRIRVDHMVLCPDQVVTEPGVSLSGLVEQIVALSVAVTALQAELAEARGGCRSLDERLWEINDHHVEGYHRD